MTTIRTFMGTLAISVVSLASFVAGCGGGSSSPITEDDFCQQKAEKECQVSARCGTGLPACVTQRKAKCLAVVAMTKTAKRVFTPTNVAGCVNKAGSVYAQQTIAPSDLAALDDICGFVFQGTSTDVCTVKYECAGGVNSKICDKGQCKAQIVTNKGQGCANAGQVCAAGSYCADDPATATVGDLVCVGKAAQSAACSTDIPCQEMFRCDGITNTCAARLASGDSCTSNDDCAVATPYCDPYIGNKCDQGLSFAAGAAACSDYGGTALTGTGGSGGGQGGSGGSNSDAGSDAIPAG
jgi:hypothetical protein